MPILDLLNFHLELMGFKSKNEKSIYEERYYDTNIDVKELKQKCGKTIFNNYDIISNGYTMRARSF